jgi:hypothetical protein
MELVAIELVPMVLVPMVLVPMFLVLMDRVLDPVLELIERSAWVLGCRRGMCLES